MSIIIEHLCRHILQFPDGNVSLCLTDLKPENIYLVEKEGKTDFVKILDFGIAKMTTMEAGNSTAGNPTGNRLTQSGMIFGTAEYMSPEQARGETPDHRVDIYALGCILYEMLTGRVPFHAETYMGTLTKHMFEVPEPPSRRNRTVPPDVEAVCLRAMEKDRTRRFQSMTEFLQALEGEVPIFQHASPQQVQDPSLSFRASAFPSGMPQGMGVGAGMPSYGQPFGMPMQPGPYGMPGQIQAPMVIQQSGLVSAPLAMSPSGMVSAPMSMGPSGMISGPLVSGVHLPSTSAGFTQTAPPAYEVARPPHAGQLRRLVFIFAGAAIGVAVLALLLLWPQGGVPVPAETGALNKTMVTAQRPSGPARLVVRGEPGSKVAVDFVEIGTISGSGELVHELTSSTGTPEWSVSVRVNKTGFTEASVRQTLRAGQTATVQISLTKAPVGNRVSPTKNIK